MTEKLFPSCTDQSNDFIPQPFLEPEKVFRLTEFLVKHTAL